MKPLRESLGMGRNRRVRNALAASTAAICALALSPTAMASAGAFCGSADQHRCGFEAAAIDGPAHPRAAGWSGASAGYEAAGALVAQTNGTPQEPAPEDEEPASETPRDTETPPAPRPEQNFEGSARPAGPDLTVTEERALISSGWE